MASFVDTNVLLYFADRAEMEKQTRAREVIRQNSQDAGMILSMQVLQEFYNNATRKLPQPLTSEEAEIFVRRFAEISTVVTLDLNVILAAIQRARDMSISFWDALIVEAALKGGAERLLTEDLQHGQETDGLVIENPFI